MGMNLRSIFKAIISNREDQKSVCHWIFIANVFQPRTSGESPHDMGLSIIMVCPQVTHSSNLRMIVPGLHAQNDLAIVPCYGAPKTF